MEIVSLNQENLDEFFRIFEILMREGYDNFPTDIQSHFLNFAYNKDFLLESQLNGKKYTYLAVVDEQIAGFIVGNQIYGGVGFISWLGVLREFRGRGIGTILLDKYEQDVEKQFGHMLSLNTYEDRMTFYERLGFKEIGRRSNGYFGLDAIIMDKKLSAFNIQSIS